MRHQSYREFWPHYLREHARPGTRQFHYAGTALTLVVAAFALLTAQFLFLLLIPVLGYGFAWVSHAFIERNKPATFTHPLWSLVSDYRMFFLALSGRLQPELRRAGISPSEAEELRSSPNR